jgi:7-cyano-7-deazaguanine reductase
MAHNPLGQKTEYKPHYDPGLLFSIERSLAREACGIDAGGFTGWDVWNGHELGWLDPKGKPLVRRVRIVYPADSRRIVESKSLKLYLGSFIMSRFDSAEQVSQTIQRDLAAILGVAAPHAVRVDLLDWREPIAPVRIDPACLIDDLDIACEAYDVDATLLRAEAVSHSTPGQSDGAVSRRHVSNLLKTNCPITGQPDWATVEIAYRGRRVLDPASLLRYLVSYREHGDYHEVCCEQIFRDLAAVLQPETLAVLCFFTRRGGIDINPLRYRGLVPEPDWSARYWRQ